MICGGGDRLRERVMKKKVCFIAHLAIEIEFKGKTKERGGEKKRELLIIVQLGMEKKKEKARDGGKVRRKGLWLIILQLA